MDSNESRSSAQRINNGRNRGYRKMNQTWLLKDQMQLFERYAPSFNTSSSINDDINVAFPLNGLPEVNRVSSVDSPQSTLSLRKDKQNPNVDSRISTPRTLSRHGSIIQRIGVPSRSSMNSAQPGACSGTPSSDPKFPTLTRSSTPGMLSRSQGSITHIKTNDPIVSTGNAQMKSEHSQVVLAPHKGVNSSISAIVPTLVPQAEQKKNDSSDRVSSPRSILTRGKDRPSTSNGARHIHKSLRFSMSDSPVPYSNASIHRYTSPTFEKNEDDISSPEISGDLPQNDVDSPEDSVEHERFFQYNEFTSNEESNTDAYLIDSTNFLAEMNNMDFVIPVSDFSDNIMGPTFKQHVDMMNSKVRELTVIFQGKLKEQYSIHRSEIDSLRKMYSAKFSVAHQLYDQKVNEMLANYELYRKEKRFYRSYRLENSKLKKQISQISEELEKRTRDEQLIQSYKEEQNTKKDQVKQMIEQWKEAMPDIPFAYQLFDEQGNLKNGTVIRTMTMNRELNDQLKKSREVGDYLRDRVVQLEAELSKLNHSLREVEKEKHPAQSTEVEEQELDLSIPEPSVPIIQAPLNHSSVRRFGERRWTSTSQLPQPRVVEVEARSSLKQTQKATNAEQDQLKVLFDQLISLRKPIMDLLGGSHHMKDKLRCSHCNQIMSTARVLWNCGHNHCAVCVRMIRREDHYSCAKCNQTSTVGVMDNTTLNALTPTILSSNLIVKQLRDVFNAITNEWNQRMLPVGTKESKWIMSLIPYENMKAQEINKQNGS